MVLNCRCKWFPPVKKSYWFFMNFLPVPYGFSGVMMTCLKGHRQNRPGMERLDFESEEF